MVVQLGYLTDEGLILHDSPLSATENLRKATGQLDVKFFGYSPDCKHIVAVCKTKLVLFDFRLEKLNEDSTQEVSDIGFSPKGKYFVAHKPYRSPKPGCATCENTFIFETETLKIVSSFTLRTNNKSNVKWTLDELFYVRMVRDALEICDITQGTVESLKVSKVADFSVSPSKDPHLAAFVPTIGSNHASVHIYKLNDLSQFVNRFLVARADSVKFHWSKDGIFLVSRISTDFDRTGSSYYGETKLFFSSMDTNTSVQLSFDVSGPVHSVDCNPTKNEFAVVYGKLPSKIVLYNSKCIEKFSFGRDKVNSVRFSPRGKYVLIGGFGNLDGKIVIWNLKEREKVCEICAPYTSEYIWAPSDDYFMTATLQRRLKVDNGFKIWHFKGALVNKVDVNKLEGAAWKPLTDGDLLLAEKNAPEVVPIPESASPKVPFSAYRPPGSRGRIQDNKPTETLINNTTSNTAPNTVSQDRGILIQKRIKVLEKKLKQIEALKIRMRDSEKLELNQIASLDREDSLRNSLQELRKELDSGPQAR